MAEGAVQERILELRQVPVLRALPPLVLGELAHAVELETLPRGALVTTEGRPVRALSWVLEGRVRWSRGGRSLGDGELGASIGMLELLAGVDASAEASAVSEIVLARMPAERWLEALEDSFDLADAVLAAVAGELCSVGCRALSRAPRLLPSSDVLAYDVEFTERLLRLRMSRPFVRAPIRGLALLAERAVVRRWARGARVWEAGREARELVVVLAGEVRDGRTRLVAGDTAGLVEALAGRRREAAAFANAASVGMVLDVEDLVDVLEDDDELALALLRASADELLAIGVARGLPPDVFGGEPDRSLPRVARTTGALER